MGCGESKHDAIATGNTVATRRKPNFHVKKLKDLGTIPEADPDAEKESDTDMEEVVAEVKDITVNSERDKEEKEGRKVVQEARQELVSPDQYFSSRKDEETIKSIVEEEAGSGYCTPHPESDKDVFFDDDGKSSDVDADKGQKLKQN